MSLPNGNRFFGLRLESIGGLGGHSAGKILASTAVLKIGLNGSNFASYGAERKGAPVRSFVRLVPADVPIRTSAPVETPDAIAVFHAALLGNPATFAGLRKEGTFIYPAPQKSIPEELAALPSTARVIRVDALAIAVKEKSRPNAVLLGTLCGAFPFLDAEKVLETMSEEFAHKPEVVAANAAAFRRGGAEFEILKNVGRAEGDLPVIRAEPAWGYETQPVGGIVPDAGSTVWNDVSVARTGSMPVFNRQNCIHCALCDMVCPDSCLVWEPGEKGGRFERELTGVDYRYCKGCMRCVETCPASAMTKKLETPGMAERLRVPLYPELIE